MPLPSNVGFGTITGRLMDSTGAPVLGTFVFTPSVTSLKNATASPKVIILPKPVSVDLDTNGAFSIPLVATDDSDNIPVNWTYQVEFRPLTPNVSLATFNTDVPENSSRDLTLLVPLSQSNGVTIRGLGIPNGGTTGQVLGKTTNADGDVSWINNGSGGSGAVSSVAGRTGVVVLTKTDVGLGSVDNTSDVNKPVSTAQQAALDLKAPLASPAFTGTPTGITKAHVGLGSVDNTADTAKPISAAQQSALDAKAPLASPTFTGTVVVPTPTTTGAATTKAYVDGLVAPAATTTTPGRVQLAGDLAGTSTAPIVAKVNGTTVSAAPTIAGQILRSTGANAASWVYSSSSDHVNVMNYGADGTNSTVFSVAQANTTAFNNAITACPDGGTVIIPAGVYRLSGPLVMKANITLRGPMGTRYPQYGGFPAHIKPYSGNFSGTEIISATEVSGWHIENLSIYGISQSTVNTSSQPIHGIGAYGKCKGVRLTEVMTYFFSGDGVHTDSTVNGWAGGWEVQNLYSASNRYGWGSFNVAGGSFGFSDSKLINSECSVNRSDGWHLEGGTAANTYDTLFAAFNGGNGFYKDGGISNLLFTACQTDRNGKNGWYSSCSEATTAASPAPHAMVFVGCIASRDGRNDDVTPNNNAGFYFDGTSTAVPHVMVTMSGCYTHVAKGDDGGGFQCPDYSVYANNGRPGGILITGSIFVAVTATLFDNNNAIVESPTNSHSQVNRTSNALTYNYVAPKAVQTVAGRTGAVVVTKTDVGLANVDNTADIAKPPTSGVITPENMGFLQWNVFPGICNSTFQFAADGTVYAFKLYTAKTLTIANVILNVSTTVGASLTAGQNLAGLYSSSKTLLGTTADQSTAWTTIGTKIMPLTVASGQSLTIPAGFFYVAAVARGTTRPAFLRTTANNSLSNGLLAAADAYWATADTGVTTALPTTLGAFSATNNPVWCGVT